MAVAFIWIQYFSAALRCSPSESEMVAIVPMTHLSILWNNLVLARFYC
jgi:hypothetical protein